MQPLLEVEMARVLVVDDAAFMRKLVTDVSRMVA